MLIGSDADRNYRTILISHLSVISDYPFVYDSTIKRKSQRINPESPNSQLSSLGKFALSRRNLTHSGC
jgi:hypothetical protein